MIIRSPRWPFERTRCGTYTASLKLIVGVEEGGRKERASPVSIAAEHRLNRHQTPRLLDAVRRALVKSLSATLHVVALGQAQQVFGKKVQHHFIVDWHRSKYSTDLTQRADVVAILIQPGNTVDV